MLLAIRHQNSALVALVPVKDVKRRIRQYARQGGWERGREGVNYHWFQRLLVRHTCSLLRTSASHRGAKSNSAGTCALEGNGDGGHTLQIACPFPVLRPSALLLQLLNRTVHRNTPASKWDMGIVRSGGEFGFQKLKQGKNDIFAAAPTPQARPVVRPQCLPVPERATTHSRILPLLSFKNNNRRVSRGHLGPCLAWCTAHFHFPRPSPARGSLISRLVCRIW
jgi:hypothetical protein